MFQIPSVMPAKQAASRSVRSELGSFKGSRLPRGLDTSEDVSAEVFYLERRDEPGAVSRMSPPDRPT
jgi:hypothetical protein